MTFVFSCPHYCFFFKGHHLLLFERTTCFVISVFTAFVCNSKSFAIAFLVVFFSSSTSLPYLDRLFFYFCCRRLWPISDILSWYAVCCQVMSFRENSNGGFMARHVEHCSSTTKNIIISPLPQCLWPPNLPGWWFTMRSSHP